MSVDHSPILAVGKWFDSLETAIKFLHEEKFMPASMEMMIANDWDLDEFLLEKDFCCGTINCYNGYGYYIGYDLDTNDIVESYKESVKKWEAMFKTPPEVVNDVRVS